MGTCADIDRSPSGLEPVIGLGDFPKWLGELKPIREVAKELGSSPSLSLSGLQGSYINCEVTLTVNGKSKTFVPKAICNGKLSDGIYVRPRIG